MTSTFSVSDYVTTNKQGLLKINHVKFARHLVEYLAIQCVDRNTFQYNPQTYTRSLISKDELQKQIIFAMEDLLHIENIFQQDKNAILDSVYIFADQKDLKNYFLRKQEKEVLVYLDDCILDLTRNITRPYQKTDFIMYKLSYKNSEALNKPPNEFLKFLDQILGGYEDKNEIIDLIQEFIGSMLTASTIFQKALLIYGSGGNGKGVMLDIISEILGRDNYVGIGLHEINKEQNTYLLLNKLSVIDHDMQQNVQLDSSIIKKLVSGESITGKQLYAQPITFTPCAKLLVATNELPYLKSIDNSISRRFVFLHLKNSFIGKEDFTLKHKLQAEKEEIFWRAVEGLKRLCQRSQFLIPNSLKLNMNQYITEQDSVEAFLGETELGKGTQHAIRFSELYIIYKQFCREMGYREVGSRKFGDRLEAHGYRRTRNAQARMISGIGYKI